MTTKATVLKAIRLNCLACCCHSVKEVSNCHIYDCTLHPYRMGTDPNPSRGGRIGKTTSTDGRFTANASAAIVGEGGE